MAMSGVKVPGEVIQAIKGAQIQKKGGSNSCQGNGRCITVGLDDLKSMSIFESECIDSSTFEEFVAKIPENQCRYYIYDYLPRKNMDGTGGGPMLIGIGWIPDTAKIKEKMVYASTLESIKKSLDYPNVWIQANDKSDLEEIDEKLRKK